MSNVIDENYYFKPSKRLSRETNEHLELIGKVIIAAIKHKQLVDTRKHGREKWEKYTLPIFKVKKSNTNNLLIWELEELVNYMADNDEASEGKTGNELFNLLCEMCKQYVEENNITII
ncbi:hypothetical protein [Desulfitobacterium hafniense]|uniref:hypothetical protein n=1 Tax=Desulfitobacterium hafniense TaxID=49338 RepID=UPI0003781F3E|nr:hypothetical protein [Desulfitobacterium hafniense]